MKRKRVPKVETVENNEKFPNAEPITRLRWEALPILNRIDRFYDFVMFVIADQDFILSDENLFFEQDRENQAVFIENYKEYIIAHIGILPIQLYSNFDFTVNFDFQSFEEFISDENAHFLLDFINEIFYENFPDEHFIGLKSLVLNIEELKSYFKQYLKFKNANSRVYISYFLLAFKYLEFTVVEFTKEAEKIDEFKKRCENLDFNLSTELQKKKRDEYKAKLYDSISNGVTQIRGYIEDFAKKDVYISYEENLIHYLKMLPEDFSDYSYQYEGINYENKLDYLNLQYLNYTYFGIEPESLKGSQSEIEAIKNDLESLRSKNKKLITFLNSKGFNDTEVNILFNLLHENKFSILNIRYHPFTKQVSQFHILYCFYILEFYENELDSIKDFENLISDITVFNVGAAEQFRKYYRNLTANNNHYPFTRIENTIKDINKRLGIDREKLKNIPTKNYGNAML